jgi:hypothetical protein
MRARTWSCLLCVPWVKNRSAPWRRLVVASKQLCAVAYVRHLVSSASGCLRYTYIGIKISVWFVCSLHRMLEVLLVLCYLSISIIPFWNWNWVGGRILESGFLIRAIYLSMNWFGLINYVLHFTEIILLSSCWERSSCFFLRVILEQIQNYVLHMSSLNVAWFEIF